MRSRLKTRKTLEHFEGNLKNSTRSESGLLGSSVGLVAGSQGSRVDPQRPDESVDSKSY